jgi:hypothetical protein
VLARNVAFVANLMDSDTEFPAFAGTACDNPHASRHWQAQRRLFGFDRTG